MTRKSNKAVGKRKKRGAGKSRSVGEPLPDFGVRNRDELLKLIASLQDNLHEGVAAMSLTGTVLYANDPFARILGRSGHLEVCGLPLAEFVSAESRVSLESALKAGAHRTTTGEIHSQLAGGKVRNIRIVLSPLRGVHAPAIGAVAVEVTELVEQGRALEAAQASVSSLTARILQVQDEERRRIARDLHDVTGQKLAFLGLNLAKLSKMLESPSPDLLTTVQECSALTRSLSEEVRTVSYLLHPPLLDDCGLGPATRWLAEGFEARSGIHVELDVDGELPRLALPVETALFRVIQEALSNTQRYSGSATARIRVVTQGGQVKLEIQDSGTGISPERLNPPEGVAPGLGVGIPGMRERVRQLGGRLEIQTSQHGTLIFVSLPMAKPATAADSRAARRLRAVRRAGAAAGSSASARILIVDDHELIRRGIRDLLRHETGLEVCGEAADGLEAVAKAAELKPDLIILDLNLPLLNGFRVGREIRRMDSTVKIVVFSTYSNPQVGIQVRLAGWSGYVSKSRGSEDLVLAIRAALSGKKFFWRDAASARSHSA